MPIRISNSNLRCVLASKRRTVLHYRHAPTWEWHVPLSFNIMPFIHFFILFFFCLSVLSSAFCVFFCFSMLSSAFSLY